MLKTQIAAENFEVVETSGGAISIRDVRVGEIMHNPLGPWREIQELYLRPSGLVKRLQKLEPRQELVLFDVGLGAGFNAMAAMLTALESVSTWPAEISFRILSFEKDLALAHFALVQQEAFPKFSAAWPALENLLKEGRWQHPKHPLRWELFAGDFIETLDLALPKPDIIFFDPYSPKKNHEMWSFHTFEKLRQKCHSDSMRNSLLLTYSRATSVRAALLLAGFYVGHGHALGLKEETTQAATVISELELPLAKRWLERWQRSHLPFPADLQPSGADEHKKWRRRLLAHPQFQES